MMQWITKAAEDILKQEWCLECNVAQITEIIERHFATFQQSQGDNLARDATIKVLTEQLATCRKERDQATFQRDNWRSDFEKAQKSAAEMREALEESLADVTHQGVRNQIHSALASTAGHDFVHKSEVDNEQKQPATLEVK